jgi:hypothetical protein
MKLLKRKNYKNNCSIMTTNLYDSQNITLEKHTPAVLKFITPKSFCNTSQNLIT